MALAPTGGIIHLPFGDRPQYGSPYPEGIAVGHIAQTGDATGGTFSMTFVADGGFLYRLEGCQLARGATAVVTVDFITSHRWASDKSGLGVSSFDLNWPMGMSTVGAFSVFTPGGRSVAVANEGISNDDLAMVRRLPMGRTDDTLLQTLMSVNISSNVNAVTHEMSVWLTYWRKESLYQPGFLGSFYEAPATPPILRRPA